VEQIMGHSIEGGCQCGAVRYRAIEIPLARTLCHCRSCRRASGAPLTYQRPSKGGSIDVSTATLDADDDFAPTKEIWTEHKLAWECLNPDLPYFARSSVSSTAGDAS